MKKWVLLFPFLPLLLSSPTKAVTINNKDYGYLYNPFTGTQQYVTDITTNAIQGSGVTITAISSGILITASGASSSLAVSQNGAAISSPTAVINFLGPPFIVTNPVPSTATINLDASSVTLQGQNVLLNSSATATYLQLSSAIVTYLQTSSSVATYFQIVSSNTLLNNSSATATYLQLSSAALTYLQNSSATATYLYLSSASLYLTNSSATLTYLQKSSATATYLYLSSASLYLVNSSATLTYLQNSSATATYLYSSSASLYLANSSATLTYLNSNNTIPNSLLDNSSVTKQGNTQVALLNSTQTFTSSKTYSDGTLLDLSAIDDSVATEGLKLPQTTDCSNATGKGQVCYDNDTPDLFIGTGTGNFNLVRILDRDVSPTSISSSAALTTFYSYVIPGGTLGTNHAIRITSIGEFLNNTGVAQAVNFIINLGTVTIFQGPAGGASVASNASTRTFMVEGQLSALNSTTLQVSAFNWTISPTSGNNGGVTGGAATTLLGAYTSTANVAKLALNSATDLLLICQWQFGAAAAFLNATIQTTQVEKL